MDDDVYADIVFIGEDDEFVKLGKCRLPLDKEIIPDTISSISCSDSGHLSVLSKPPELSCTRATEFTTIQLGQDRGISSSWSQQMTQSILWQSWNLFI